MYPKHDEDVLMVAMIQALLSEGLAQFLHDTGKSAEVMIQSSMFKCHCTRAGLQAQMLPLWPFATHYTRLSFVNIVPCSAERMDIGVVERAANEG
jgi:hypothetical protein